MPEQNYKTPRKDIFNACPHTRTGDWPYCFEMNNNNVNPTTASGRPYYRRYQTTVCKLANYSQGKNFKTGRWTPEVNMLWRPIQYSMTLS